MKTPGEAWKSGKRWPFVAGGIVGVLVLAFAACETAGWPFLAGPIQERLARVLDRTVAFGTDQDRGVRIHLLGGVRVSAASIEIGSPAWSQAPYMVLAKDATLGLGYIDLFRVWRGQALHVKRLEAASLDVNLERMADGRASWQFGEKAPAETADKPAALPTFGRLRVDDGHISYQDAILPASIDSRFALADGSGGAAALPALAASEAGASAQVGAASATASASAVAAASAIGNASAPGIVVRAGDKAGRGKLADRVTLAEGESGLVLKATGTYRKNLPVRIDLRTAGVLRLFDADSDAEAQPLRLEAAIGNAALAFDGSTTDPLHFRGLKGKFRVSGPSLAAAGEPLGITLPSTPAFKTHGTIAKDSEVWNAVFESAEIGSTRLNGQFTFDRRPAVPLLSGKLGGSRLALVDLGPAIGAAAPGEAPSPKKAGDRVIPDTKFDLPSLRAMDANVLVDIAAADPNTKLIAEMRPLKGHIILSGGVLTISDLEGSVAQGRVAGYLQLDGRAEQAKWTADVRAFGVDLSQWLKIERKAGQPPYLTGKMDAMVKVKGQGRSTAEILGTLGGDLRVHLRDATVSHLAIEGAGIDVAQALGVLLKGDDALPILCNVADLDIENGVARPKAFVFNTPDSTIWIDGTISLKTEAMDLRAVTSPKDFSPLTLRTPVHVRGTLGDPKVSLELGKLVAKGAAAGLLALLNPLLALVPFIDPGAKADAEKAASQCASVAKSSGAIAAAVKTPVNVKVPAASVAPPKSASAARS